MRGVFAGGLLVLVGLLAGCALDEQGLDETSETESATTSGQGTTYQGTTYQGTTYQGTTYQGTTYQGTTYQGTTYQGAVYGTSWIIGNVSLSKSTIVVWRQLDAYTWEQRGPTYKCTHNSNTGSSCTYYALSRSPLTGMKFATTFINPDGTTRSGYLQIGASTTAYNAVTTDSSIAMHPLEGAAQTTHYGYGVNGCTHPNGCRRNSDLYLYDIKIVDTDGSIHPFCPSGHRAYAFAGVWDLTGQRTTGGNKFTFACTNGTIAKCAAWGYRPFGQARWTDSSMHALEPYHQACVRAATADYCASGRSFTKDGTTIDIYDYSHYAPYLTEHGFIPNTRYQYFAYRPTALQWESTFDSKGALRLDFTRYVEGDVDDECPDRFNLPVAGYEWGAPRIVRERHESIEPEGPTVSVGNVGVCSHSEKTVGKWLHPLCSECTQHLANNGYEELCMRVGTSWSQTCVNAASSLCSAGVPNPETTTYNPPKPEQMSYHGECSTGYALETLDSACTLAVCSADPSCCSSSWTSSCVTRANETCKGGREGFRGFPPEYHGFCGTPTNGGFETSTY